MVKKNKEETKIIQQEDIEVISDDNTAKKQSKAKDDMAFKDGEEKKTISVKDEFEENLVEKYKDYKILDIKSFKKFLMETKDFLFGITLEKSNYVENNEKEISKQIKFPIKFGLIAVAITLGFFGVWSGFAPLDSASIAEGYVVLSDHRKQIFHESGGVIEKILIKDGDEVQKGQPLIVLNEYKAKAELESVLWQLRHTIVDEKRLSQNLQIISYYLNGNQNEIKSMQVNFDNKYLDTKNERVLKLIEAQKNSFESFKSFIESNVKSFNAQIEQVHAEINASKERIDSYKENITTLEKEYNRKKKLYEKQLETSERLSQVKVQLQEYKGRELEEQSRLAGAQHRIAEIEAKKAQFMEEQNVRLSDEYKKNHTELLKLEAQYIHVKDAHERTTITAPNAGIITGLNIHTIGSAIRQNDKPLVEIIPQDDNQVIEAFIPSGEIDSITVGSIARIQLNAYKARLVPRIEGKVIYISADKFDKEMPGMVAPGVPKYTPAGYYKAKIEITPEELAKINMDVKLFPGMPVTVFIVKGSRSFAEYLYSPIKDSFHRAFKEP
ncbi:HlyD family type I secretion periplasmic adaptor subunit [Rickettsiales endosymbiont of Trichoplax sp. H2]|uniref:HlyD family type I secretion periplasmic adaptor subunit n=1 Tax=Rickettsiales endosymbiont of Trichoplax sp. H2 TaxID=2021221 RepID=UPI0012B1B1B1|nr:HlyD family type I secretion periplasmic adaptor subunit [Rickettsiales endosymbiont of Trichoplax sp. H2]MSO14507.1 Type I secretion system membrane fusion protein PrsE [Rickettsiales endosymbiont of Trichoplax sp. H2]